MAPCPIASAVQRSRWRCFLLALAAAPAAHAFPVTVNLRVEGPTKTVFDGPVTTDAHDVTTARRPARTSATARTARPSRSLARPPPAHSTTPPSWPASPSTARTATSGSTTTSSSGWADEQIDPNSEYWSLWINHGFSDKGGCQKRVLAGQDVLWAGIPFSVSIPLKLTGPDSAVTGQPVQVKVTDGSNGNPQGRRDGRRRDHRRRRTGHAHLRERGHLPAQGREAGHGPLEHASSLCVDPPGAAPCTSTDSTRRRSSSPASAPPIATCQAGGLPAAMGARARSSCRGGPRTAPAAAWPTTPSR